MSADAARSSFKRSISEPTMSAHPHDGGLAFPLPAHNVRAILCTLMLELMEPYGANQPDPTGAAWNAIPLTLMLRAADAPLDHSVGLLYETDWVYLADNMQQHDAPTNWIRTCRAWQLIQPYIDVTAPATYEQVLSMPTCADGIHTYVWKLWEGGAWTTPDAPPDVSADQHRLLVSGPTAFAPGMWALMDECPLELHEPEHLATGMRHYLHGYLMHLDATHLRVATGTTYLFTCNGWQKTGLGVCNLDQIRHATVEPWPGGEDALPDKVVLVGPTATHWAASRGRLMWADVGETRPYYDCLISAKLRDFRARWNQERHGDPRPQPRMLKQLQTLGCGTKDIRTSIEIIDASPWSPKLDTFARRLAAGVLPMGKATGCKLAPDYTATTHGCLLCDGPDGKDCVEHVFGECPTLAPLREWTHTALSRLAGWVPPTGGECRHLVYGRKSHTPVDSTIRAAALDTIRTMRAAKIASEHRRAEAVRQGDTPEKRMTAPPPRVVVAALRNRLGAAIAKDWLAAAGLAADRHNTDARTRAARPTNIDEFQERWGSVSDVSDGRCTPHPRKLETEMEPD